MARIAEGVAHDEGIAVILSVTDGSACRLVAPDLVAVIEPRSVGGVTVVDNELLDRGEFEALHAMVEIVGVLDSVGFGVGKLAENLLMFGKGLGVAGVERGVTDVAEVKEEEHDTLETDTATSVGEDTKLEALEVFLHAERLDAGLPHALLEQVRPVDTLTTSGDFLATEEDVEGVGETVILGVEMGIEGANRGGELVDDVIVGLVLLLDDPAQLDLGAGAQILNLGSGFAVVIGPAGIVEQLDGILEGNDGSLW